MAVAVTGLDGLIRAFAAADRTVKDDLRDAVAESAAPVRADAQTLAGAAIRNLGAGDPWTKMRVGILGRSVAYIAPVERGVKVRGGERRRRGWGTGPPSFPALMLDRAMQPALDRNVHNVERRFEELLDEVANVWERR